MEKDVGWYYIACSEAPTMTSVALTHENPGKCKLHEIKVIYNMLVYFQNYFSHFLHSSACLREIIPPIIHPH